MSASINRELTVELLKSMEVELPPKTKLSDNELDKRLSKVLDGCQYLARIPKLPLNPASYPLWQLDKTNKPIFDAVRRHNIGESGIILQNMLQGNANLNPFPLFENPFMDVRQSLMTIGKNWDEGCRTMILQDKEQQSCICIRVLEVLEFDKETPILIVLFRQEFRGTIPTNTLKWVMLHGKDGEHGKKIAHIIATTKEQHLVMRLLRRNNERLVSSYQPKRIDLERFFDASFILPVGPLGAKDVAKYNKNDGCSVCGDTAKNKCSRCNVTRYCSAVCQKDDWKSHRPTCTSLKGATWQTIPFRSMDNLMGLRNAWRTNRFDNVQHRDMLKHTEKASDGPLVNMYGSTPFVVKVQLNVIHGGDLLIYDRRRAFEVSVTKALSPPAAFNTIAEVVKTKGEGGLKAFCWATRSGEWTVDICTDQLPDWQKW